MGAKTTAALLLAAGALFPLESAARVCLGNTEKAYPGYRPDYYSVRQEFRRATYVVEVRSLKERWLDLDGKSKPLAPPFTGGSPHPLGFDEYGGALYEVEVLRAFKGEPPRRLTLFSENTSARFHLVAGQKYLLFVDRVDSGLIGEQLSVNVCGNSGDLARSGQTIKQLRKLERPMARSQ